MLTIKDLYDIVENKIANDVQKAMNRNNMPPQISGRMFAAIDGKEKAEHIQRLLMEYKDLMLYFKKGVRENVIGLKCQTSHDAAVSLRGWLVWEYFDNLLGKDQNNNKNDSLRERKKERSV